MRLICPPGKKFLGALPRGGHMEICPPQGRAHDDLPSPGKGKPSPGKIKNCAPWLLVRHPWWRTEAKLLIVLVQVCLRVPPLAEAKLVIVCTYFFLILSFSPGSLPAPPMVANGSEAGDCFHLLFFFFLRLLLFTHFGESPVRENLFPPNILA